MAVTKESIQAFWAIVAFSIGVFQYFTFPQKWVPTQWTTEIPYDFQMWALASVAICNICIISIISLLWFVSMVLAFGANLSGKKKGKLVSKKE